MSGLIQPKPSYFVEIGLHCSNHLLTRTSYSKSNKRLTIKTKYKLLCFAYPNSEENFQVSFMTLTLYISRHIDNIFSWKLKQLQLFRKSAEKAKISRAPFYTTKPTKPTTYKKKTYKSRVPSAIIALGTLDFFHQTFQCKLNIRKDQFFYNI